MDRMMLRTANNLMICFFKESYTRVRYELYAEIAKKENLLLISRTFKDFATQKIEDANWYYTILQELKKDEYFEDIPVQINGSTTYGTSIQNLEASIKEEDEAWQKLYPNYANTAEREGYSDIAKKLRKFAQIKKNLSQRLKMFANLINSNAFSKKDSITLWKCLACGFEIAINELPNDYNCPTCGHIKSYFQKKTLQLIQDEISYQKKEMSGWLCMECGYEVALEELPEDWKCLSCGHSKEYFKRKILKQKDYAIKSTEREKAHWVCLECGNEEDIEMPIGWKCPKCGFPRE
jgi:rubrerythrin